MKHKTTTGGCQCGALRYAFTGEPIKASICHCRMCQKAFGNFGGAFVEVKLAAFSWTHGTPSAFRSSPPVARGFCEKCGTPMFLIEDGQDIIELSAGTLDDPSGLVFKHQVGVESRQPWFNSWHLLPEMRTDQDRTPEDLAKLKSLQHPDHE